MHKTGLIRTDIRVPAWAYEIVEARAKDEGIPKATILRSLVLKALKNEGIGEGQ